MSGRDWTKERLQDREITFFAGNGTGDEDRKLEWSDGKRRGANDFERCEAVRLHPEEGRGFRKKEAIFRNERRREKTREDGAEGLKRISRQSTDRREGSRQKGKKTEA